MLERLADAWRSLVGPPALTLLSDPTLRALQEPSDGGGGLVLGVRRTGNAPRRGTAELMRAYRDMPRLRAVTSKIAEAVASTVWRGFRPINQGGRRSLARAQKTTEDGGFDSTIVDKAIEAGEVEEIFGHPALALLRRWNPSQTGRAAWAVTQKHLDLKGETFLLIERAANGDPIMLFPIPPHWVQDVPSRGQPFFKVKRAQFSLDVLPDDMLWLRELDPEDPYGRGTGIGESLADELDADEYAAKHIKAWFYNRAMPDLMISVPGLNQDEIERAKQAFEDRHRGGMRAHKTHWHNGEMKVEQLSQTFADQQLVELRQFERDVIFQTYGVPPEIFGVLENSNRATIEAAAFLFASGVVVPRLEFWRTELQHMLLDLSWPGEIVIGYDSPIPDDKRHKLDAMRAKPDAFMVDEWRAAGGHEPLADDGGQIHAIEGSTGYTDDLASVAPAATVTANENQARAALPEAKQSPSRSDLTALVDEMTPIALTDKTAPELAALVEEWGSLAILETGAEVAFNSTSPAVLSMLAEHEARLIRHTHETTKRAVTAQLIEGAALGEDIPTLARRIRGVMGAADKKRSIVIARTEVLRASNAARIEGFKQSGLVKKHKWLATRDARTRPADPSQVANHRGLNGQIVELGKPFKIDGKQALGPGQFGLAAWDIQCRCVTVPVVDTKRSKGEIGDATEHARLARRLRRWDARIRKAIRAGFNQQRDTLIAELTRRFGS